MEATQSRCDALVFSRRVRAASRYKHHNFSECRKRTAGHVTKFPSCNGERSWWLLSNDKRLRSATARALWKKGESSAPSVFHAFLGAICERPLMVQTQLKTKPRHILLKLNSKEMKWTPGHIHALLCSVSCLPRETELAAYKISTSPFANM